jgi:hypothetical protein
VKWLRRTLRLAATPAPLSPRVGPNVEDAKALERQRAKLAYRPSNGFLTDGAQERKGSK